MGFKCDHCGSNRAKKVNGKKVCADCGRSGLSDNVVLPNSSLEPVGENSSRPASAPRHYGNSPVGNKDANFVFWIVLVVIFSFVIFASIISAFQNDEVKKFAIVETVTTEFKGIDETHQMGGAWYTIVGKMKNVSSKDYDDLDITIEYQDFEGVKHYGKHVAVWLSGATLSFNDDIFVVCAYENNELIPQAPSLRKLTIMRYGVVLYEKIGDK